MRCLAVCQDELVIRMLDQILAPSVEVEFLVESPALARKLQAADLPIVSRRPEADRHLPEGRYLTPDLRHYRGQRPEKPAEG